MTSIQKTIKYLAIALAVFLTVSIIGGILSAIGLFGGFFDNEAVEDDLKTYSVSSDIRSLDIEIGAADFTIEQADGFSLESNLKYLTVTEKNGKLIVKEQNRFGSTYTGALLKLSVPAETVFDEVEITTGAGRLTADTLTANSLKLELGAGEVNIGSLSATNSADIDGGAGKITISGGFLHDLDMDMGVGELNLTSAVSGNSEFDLGVGESNITFIGDKSDYSVAIEKGIGSVTVDGKNVSDYEISGNGQNRVEISGGIGAIILEFKQSETK